MSFSTVLSAAIDGIAAEFVRVEADVSNGLPVFHMVGYLSSEVKEAGERVRTAIRNSGISVPARKIVVNLSPASLRKRGASFDLPIAAAILASLGEIPQQSADGCVLVGELGLDGRLRKVPGILPIVMEAVKRKADCCVIPAENAREGALVKGIRIIGAESLAQVISHLKGERMIPETPHISDHGSSKKEGRADFADLKGQENVRRAAEIAVAGGHNLLLIGPPGSGKSMAAECIAGILPPLKREESLEITKIYSVMGLLDEQFPMIMERPFREVHHTATRAALIGGGAIPRPGEISLAHGGVLFLDELAEFKKGVLEVLRQPLEKRSIQINRVYGNYSFPANFILVAAMNPCPCGCYPDRERCTCTPPQIQTYLNRISQPFLDRIDLCAEARPVRYEDVVSEAKQESSEEIRKRVCGCRKVQEERYKGTKIRVNALLESSELKTYCELGGEEQKMMERAFEVMKLSARAYHRIIRVARTIADLDGEEKIGCGHLREAIGYRTVDRKYWGR